MTCSVDESGCSVRKARKPAVTINSPPATTRLLPKRCTQTLLSGAATMIVTACGSRTAPALIVEYPSTDCRYCVIRNSVPNSEKNAIVIAPLAALNRGFWKKCMLSIGLDVCSSHSRNVTSRRDTDREAGEHVGCGPAVRRCLDHRPQERRQSGDGQQRTERVEPRRRRIARLGNEQVAEDETRGSRSGR